MMGKDALKQYTMGLLDEIEKGFSSVLKGEKKFSRSEILNIMQIIKSDIKGVIDRYEK